MKQIDARGKNCPLPVLMAKKAVTDGEIPFHILVDNPAAVENLRRLAAYEGYTIAVSPSGSDFSVIFSTPGVDFPHQTAFTPPAVPDCSRGDYVIFIGREGLGEGDPVLGKNLIRMLCYTLTQTEDLPSAMLFMNGGVKLPVGDHQIADHLKVVQEKGVEVLVCGACLDFYGLRDQLLTGTVSNMYEIFSRMQTASKVISL